MTQQIINLGTGPDSQTGDTLYVAFTKVNENFSEVYSVFGANEVGGRAHWILLRCQHGIQRTLLVFQSHGSAVVFIGCLLFQTDRSIHRKTTCELG